MIILVFGLPGTGKTYFSKHFADELGAVHLNTDIVREKLGFRGQYDEKTKQQVYNELFKQAQLELKNDTDIIIDGTFHLHRRRKQVERLAAETNNRIYYIEIKADERTINKRLKKNRSHSDAKPDVYEELKNDFEPVEKDVLELWSEKKEEMIEKAKAYING